MLLFFSCKKDSAFKTFQPKTTESIQILKDSNFVGLDLAATAAKQVNQSQLVSRIIAKKAVNGLNLPAGKQILDTLALPNNIDPSYYIFNYLGGGYVIIAADKRVEPILGYENDSYFPHSGTLSGGLVNWLVVNHKNMLLLRKNSGLKTPPIVAEHWKELISSKTSGNIGLNNIDNQPPPPCQPTNIDNIVGPYLTTTWGQGIPYNLLCPAGTYDNGHTPTGCVATAMAQVMYYWKAPAYYNWNTMPITYNYNDINYPGNRDVAQLMVDVGQSVDMAYSATTSSTDGSKGAAALRNVFHYTSSANGNFDYKKVMNNLDARQPVLLAASTDYHSFF